MQKQLWGSSGLQQRSRALWSWAKAWPLRSVGSILPASPHPQFKQLSAEGLPQVNVTPGERGAGAPQKVSSLPWPFAASATTLNLLMELHGIPTAVSPHGGWAAAAVRPAPGPHLMLCPLSALRLDTTTPHPLWTGAAADLCALPLGSQVTALIQHHWAVLLQLLLSADPLCESDVMALTCH